MKTATHISKILLIASVALLTACAGPKYAFQQESFDSSVASPFDHHFAASKQVVYESLKRVALRDGFAVERESNDEHTLVVSKQYQDGESNTLLTISGLVTGGDTSADTWIAAQEVTIKSHAATQTASVGILLGLSIPVPTGTVATLTKERGETVMDRSFYNKIYAAVEKEIPEVKAQLDAASTEDDTRLRAEIEKKMRIEMEVRAKLEQEQAQAAHAASATVAVAPAPTSVPTPAVVVNTAAQ
jgi:hypothetical protein